MVHVIWVPIILIALYGCYGAFFREKYVKQVWKGSKYLPFLPKEYEYFVPVFRGLMLAMLICAIALYIFILLGLIPH